MLHLCDEAHVLTFTRLDEQVLKNDGELRHKTKKLVLIELKHLKQDSKAKRRDKTKK